VLLSAVCPLLECRQPFLQRWQGSRLPRGPLNENPSYSRQIKVWTAVRFAILQKSELVNPSRHERVGLELQKQISASEPERELPEEINGETIRRIGVPTQGNVVRRNPGVRQPQVHVLPPQESTKGCPGQRPSGAALRERP